MIDAYIRAVHGVGEHSKNTQFVGIDELIDTCDEGLH
jgi:hypothetical protein